MVKFAQMPKYEAYKDSGVEWLGDIPCGWSLKPGFVAFSENKRSNKGMIENTVLSLSYGHIVIRPEEKLTGLVPESFETYQLVEPGDIIVRCMDLQNDKVSLRTGFSKSKGIITSAYLNLKVNSDFESRFIHYYLHSLDTTKVLYQFGSGLRQNLSFLDFKKLPVFSIPKSVQTTIADYLDQKTAQIDAAIAIKEQQIELLKERKQIIIQQAVTQGLDPNVPMKDSGVEWIGQIPEHWEVKPLKFYIEKKIDNRGRTPAFGDLGVPMLEVKNITDGNHHPTEAFSKYVDPKLVTSYEREKVKIGDILISTVGATAGKAVIIKNEPNYFICQNVIGLRLIKEVHRLFASYALASLYFKTSLMLINKGNTIDNLKVSVFVNNPLLLPPREEQENISVYIVGSMSEIDHGISLQIQQIEKLKEYKTTLINSAVTGKIKITPEMLQA